MLRIFQLNLRWRIERELMKWRIIAICLHLSRVYHSFVHWILARLIIKLSFKLTFWTQIEIESNCSHFQLDLSRVAHIFNLTQLDSTENWVNSTRLAKNSSLTSRELNIEIFPTFALSFCIIFLVESHEGETWRSFDRESWRES